MSTVPGCEDDDDDAPEEEEGAFESMPPQEEANEYGVRVLRTERDAAEAVEARGMIGNVR